MAGLSTPTQHLTFEISGADVKGPLNLSETELSGQTCEPEWWKEGASFTDVEVLNDTPVKYTLTQTGDSDRFSLGVRAIPANAPTLIELATNLKKHLSHVLGLKDDLDLFYRKFTNEDEILALTFTHLRGLRLMRSTDLFQALICSMLSQNNSVRLWNRSARLMMKHYGRVARFSDGSREFLFPRAAALARLNPRELRSKTSMGYRAHPIVKVSRMIVNGDLDLIDLAGRHYEDALDSLLELPGVGPKVADCFLLYGAGQLEAAPVDVWIHRVVSKLYFPGKKISRMKTARFLRERFLEWAGYAQLYLFDYARRGQL
jgi:N-glycosylase/DNA lyase